MHVRDWNVTLALVWDCWLSDIISHPQGSLGCFWGHLIHPALHIYSYKSTEIYQGNHGVSMTLYRVFLMKVSSIYFTVAGLIHYLKKNIHNRRLCELYNHWTQAQTDCSKWLLLNLMTSTDRVPILTCSVTCRRGHQGLP